MAMTPEEKNEMRKLQNRIEELERKERLRALQQIQPPFDDASFQVLEDFFFNHQFDKIIVKELCYEDLTDLTP